MKTRARSLMQETAARLTMQEGFRIPDSRTGSIRHSITMPVIRRVDREMHKMTKTTFLLAAITGLALTACVDTVPVVEEVDVLTIAPTSADRATPAYKSCVAAIAKQVGVSTKDVAVFDYQFSEAGTQIQASVAGAVAPWRCLSANDGTVAEVSYTGSEGAL